MAYNGKELEILKEIVSRIQISAQIILSDGRKGFTEDKALKVIRWADKMEIHYAYLELVKKGLIAPDIRNDGEVTLWPIPHLTQQSDQLAGEWGL